MKQIHQQKKDFFLKGKKKIMDIWGPHHFSLAKRLHTLLETEVQTLVSLLGRFSSKIKLIKKKEVYIIL